MNEKNIGRISFTDKNITFLLGLLLLIVDYMAIICAEESALWIRTFILNHPNKMGIPTVHFWLFFPGLYIMLMHMEGLYSKRIQFWQMVQKIFIVCLYGIITVVFLMYVTNIAGNISRQFMLYFGVLSFAYIVFSRFLIKRFLVAAKLLQIPVLIVGAGKTAEILVKGITGDSGVGYRVLGLLDDNGVYDSLKQYPLLGGFNDLEKVINITGVKDVIIASPGVSPLLQGELIYRAQSLVKNVGVVPNLIGMPVGGLEVESLFSEKLMILKVKNNLARPINKFLKQAFDYVLTLTGTVIFSPFFVGIALWVYFDSPGDIFFKHLRVGRNGKRFYCYKFRSMHVNAAQMLNELLEKDSSLKKEWEQNFKLKDDPRITRSGAFLRRTSLDELPQIFNILRGEMSLVGPRPIVEAEFPYYGKFLKEYLMVKPGITGYWQINGRSNTTYEERVQMDVWYVHNWSLWLDIMLLWRTFKSTIKQEGAY